MKKAGVGFEPTTVIRCALNHSATLQNKDNKKGEVSRTSPSTMGQ